MTATTRLQVRRPEYPPPVKKLAATLVGNLDVVHCMGAPGY